MEKFEQQLHDDGNGTERITQDTSENLGKTITDYQENDVKFFGPGMERKVGNIQHIDGGFMGRGKPKN